MEESSSSPQFLILPLVQPDQDDEVDIAKIRELTSRGLVGVEPEDRCVAWLVLLDIYPQYARQWQSRLKELVSCYEAYVNECQINDWQEKKFDSHVFDFGVFNLPNNSMMGQIHSDLVRTRRNITIIPNTEFYNDKSLDESTFYSIHLRRLERVLYILGNVNQNFQYMQGFNELITPFYYTLYCAKSLFKDDFEIEALTFHCLHQLLSYTELICKQVSSSIIMKHIKVSKEKKISV